MDQNPWELYSTKAGWELVSTRLDQAIGQALAALDRTIEAGAKPTKAAEQAFQAVLTVMDHPENNEFGAGDSEPRDHLAALIERHLRDRYDYRVYVDRWGSAADDGRGG